MAPVPSILAVRLGPDASKGLNDLLDTEQRESSERVLTISGERFDRRLAEELSGLRQEIAKDRFELLKWMFVFWIGQLAAMSAIMSFLLRK